MSNAVTDRDLIVLLRSRLASAVSIMGWTFPVVSKQQPDNEGVEVAGTAVYHERLFDKRFGYPKIEFLYDNVAKLYKETSTQRYETTFQISALSIPDPTNTTAPTASDIADAMSNALNAPATVRLFAASNVEVLRVSEVRNMYFKDDREQTESNPSFDIVVAYKRAWTDTIDAAIGARGGDFPI